MSSQAIEFRFRRFGRGTFFGGVLITIAIHGALLFMIWWAHFGSPPPPEAARDVLVTKLVMLGKPREKIWLPRKVIPPKPEAPVQTIKVTENETAAPVQKAAPRPEDADVSKNMKRALERARMLAQASAEEPPEGALTGSTAGTSNTASEGDPYATSVMEAVRKNWNVPSGLSLGAVINLAAEVRVSIGDDGTISGARLNKKSGNGLFDDSCIQAVEATGKVPAPPANQRAKYRRGVLLDFDGKDLAR